MTQPIDPALVARLVNLARSIADPPIDARNSVKEARAIVAELPAPVDPDLLLAREIINEVFFERGLVECARDVAEGIDDDSDEVTCVLRAIKRVRQEAPRSACLCKDASSGGQP